MSLAIAKLDGRPRITPPYIPATEAVAMLKCSDGHFRRLCSDRWGPAGLARKFGGEWAVLPDADPRLHAHESWDARDLRQLAELRAAKTKPRYIELAEQRRDIVLGFDAFEAGQPLRKAGAQSAYIARLIVEGVIPCDGISKLSSRTLDRWETLYKADGDAGGIKALVKLSGGPKGEDSIGEQAWEYFLRIKSVNRRSVADAYKVTLGIVELEHKDEDGWEWPALRTVQLAYQTRVPLPEKVLAEQGPHKMRALTLPKITRSLEDVPAGSHLVGDERTLDVMCRVPRDKSWARVRPKLTAWMDSRSRMIPGWIIAERANSDTILSTFRMAAEAMETVPDEVTCDNGVDYRTVAGRSRRTRKWDEFDSKWVHGAFERLSVTVHFALKKHPWSKSIESRFSTIGERFDKYFASYWGGKIDNRPWDAEAFTKANLEALPTIEEMHDAFEAFVAVLHEEVVAGDGMFELCPRQAMRQFYTSAPRRVESSVLEMICCRMHGPVKVSRDGLRFNHILYGKHDEAVWRLQGKEVYFLTDPVQADRITICDGEGVPTCVAYADRNLGITQDEVRAAQAMTKKAEKTIKNYDAARDHNLMTTPQKILAARAAAAKLQQIPDGELPAPTGPETLRIVRPDVAAGAEQIWRAVGAEDIRRLAELNAGAAALNELRSPDLRRFDCLEGIEGAEPPAPVAFDLRQLSTGMETDHAG